jgi:hypothetical protein
MKSILFHIIFDVIFILCQVGIGPTAPSAKLDVNGDLKLERFCWILTANSAKDSTSS